MNSSTFDRLVSEISDDERSELLDELSRSMQPQGETVLEEDRQDEYSDAQQGLEQRFRRLGLLSRIWLLIRSFFRGASPLELYEHDMLRDLARRVDRAAPGLISVADRLALPGLYNRVRDLESAARTCRTLLGPITGTQKGEFLSVLLGFEHYECRTVFDTEMNPDDVASEHPDFSEADVKRHMENRLEDVLQSVPSDVRTRMYVSARYIDNVRELAAFEFARFFALFHSKHGTEVESPPLKAVAGYLERLAVLFQGLRVPPGELMTRALFSWLRLDDAEGVPDEGNHDSETATYRVQSMTHALGVIAEFGRTVPLVSLMRVAENSLSYTPEHAGGGEDWFATIKKYWHAHIDTSHREFVVRQRRMAFLKRASDLCHTEVRLMHAFPGLQDDTPGQYAGTMGFLKSFFSSLFETEVQGPLRLLQVHGQFYKDANRSEFNDAFETMRAIPGRIRRLQRDVSAEGTTGLMLRRVSQDYPDPQKRMVERRKVLALIHKTAAQIATDSISSLRSVTAILNGILYGEVGGPYDTLSNMNSIDGRNSEQYRKKLDSVLVSCKAAEEITAGLFDLESMQDTGS